MNNQRWLCLFLAGVAWFLDPVSGHAQPRPFDVPRRPYVPIPFEGDLDRALADQLLRARGIQDLKALIDQVQKNPAAFKAFAQDLPKLDLDDPTVREALGNLLQRQPDLFKVSPEQAKAIQHLLKTREASRPGADPPAGKTPPSPQAPNPGGPPSAEQPPAGKITPQLPQATTGEDLLAQWTRDFLEEAETWDWDDLIKDSPALQGGLRDLQELVVNGQGGSGRFDNATLGRWAERLRPDGKLKLSLPDVRWAKWPDLAMPSLRLPRLGAWDGGSGLGAGLPRLGGAASGRAALWIAVVALAVLVLWQIARQWNHKMLRQARARWHPGPWPVHPGQIATRTDVVRAFEYLSLLHLGPDARSWNHRRIAATLGADPHPNHERRQAADALAVLYERARYAPAADPLPTTDLESARRALCLLAGVASP